MHWPIKLGCCLILMMPRCVLAASMQKIQTMHAHAPAIFFALTSANQAISKWPWPIPKGLLAFLPGPSWTARSHHFHRRPGALSGACPRGRSMGCISAFPVKGRVSGQWTIQLSRALQRNGHFLGVVVVSIPGDYLPGGQCSRMCSITPRCRGITSHRWPLLAHMDTSKPCPNPHPAPSA